LIVFCFVEKPLLGAFLFQYDFKVKRIYKSYWNFAAAKAFISFACPKAPKA